MSEVVDLHETLEEVIKLERLLLDSKQIQVAREYGEIPFIKVQKSKLVPPTLKPSRNSLRMKIFPPSRQSSIGHGHTRTYTDYIKKIINYRSTRIYTE